MKLSMNLIQFWDELVKVGKISKLDNLASKVSKGIIDVKDGYEHLVSNFDVPDRCRDFFRSFMVDITMDMTNLNPWVSKLIMTQRVSRSKTLSYFNEQNGIILISGNPENIGEIVFANLKFSEILGQNLNTIVGSNISTFIPWMYSRRHDHSMLNFVRYCKDSEVPFSGSLFIQVEKGYLVECIIKSRCTAINNNVFFLTLVQKVSQMRHIILYHEDGIIASYDKSLTELVGITDLKNSLIQEIFNLDLNDLNLDCFHMFKYNGKKLGAVKTTRYVASTTMNVLLIYENIKEYHEKQEIYSEDDDENYESLRENEKKNNKVAFVLENNLSYNMAPGNTNFESINNLKNEEKTSQSTTSALGANEKYSQKILNQALKGIDFYKWILLVFVNNI